MVQYTVLWRIKCQHVERRALYIASHHYNSICYVSFCTLKYTPRHNLVLYYILYVYNLVHIVCIACTITIIPVHHLQHKHTHMHDYMFSVPKRFLVTRGAWAATGI